MKTTIELPDITLRRVKAFAAARGMTMKQFFTEAVEQQLHRRAVAVRTGADASADAPTEPPWMEGFGALSDLGEEHRLVLHTIDDEFETLAPDDIR